MGLGALSVSVLIGLSSRVSHDILGLAAAALIVLPALFALAAPQQDEIRYRLLRPHHAHGLAGVQSDLPSMGGDSLHALHALSIATGALVGLIPGAAKSYGVNGDNVAWVNGLLGGLLTAAGSLAGAAIPARISAPVIYLSVGIVNAATLAVLWLGPVTPATYYLGVLLYLFTVGTAYGLFTAVVLEFLGDSGKSGCGRYSIINSIGNYPCALHDRVDGWGADRWGARALTGTECVVGGLGATLLLSYFLLRGKKITTFKL